MWCENETCAAAPRHNLLATVETARFHFFGNCMDGASRNARNARNARNVRNARNARNARDEWTQFACSRVRVCACARVRVCACARVRVFACSRVRVCACSRVRVFACSRVRVCLVVFLRFAAAVSVVEKHGIFSLQLLQIAAVSASHPRGAMCCQEVCICRRPTCRHQKQGTSPTCTGPEQTTPAYGVCVVCGADLWRGSWTANATPSRKVFSGLFAFGGRACRMIGA